MRMTVFFIAMLLLTGNASISYGQELTASHRNDIRKLLNLTLTDPYIETWVNGFTKIFSDAASAGRTEDKKKAINEISESVRDVIIEEFPTLLEQMIPLYGQYYTHDEIKQLIAFYESPVGKKTIKIMPILTQRGMELGRSWGEGLGPKLEQRLKEKGLLE